MREKEMQPVDDVYNKNVKKALIGMSVLVVIALGVGMYSLANWSLSQKSQKENPASKPKPYTKAENHPEWAASEVKLSPEEIAMLTAPEPNPETKPVPLAEFNWDDLKNMAIAKVGDNWNPSIWVVDPSVPLLAFDYRKDNKMTLWIVNPKKKKYIKKICLTAEKEWTYYHVNGNKKDRYYTITKVYTLVHEVNGKERDRYEYLRSINLIPGPDNYRDDDDDEVPEEYSSWEDYYYENSDGIDYYYYGGN